MTVINPKPSSAAPFRRATPEDVDDLVQFVEFASEGLGTYLWSRMAGGSDDPWQIGRERVRSATSPIFHGNAIIAEIAGRPAAGLIGYAADSKAGPLPDDLPALLVPLQELTNEAADTWYVHVLAAHAPYRGKGLGSSLLALADRLAAAAGKAGLSLIVSDTNTQARRLYESSGYREVARRRMVKECWQHPGIDWVLMRKDA
jgi:ribosomal protein S18 acetylase RimI-like enzyme